MSEQLQNKLVEVVSQIQQAVSQSSSFVLEQLPDIVQQYVLWGRVSTALTSLCLLFAVYFFYYFSYKVWKKPMMDTNIFSGVEYNSEVCWLLRCALPAAAIGFSIWFAKTLDLMVWLAPKVWLIKELAALIK